MLARQEAVYKWRLPPRNACPAVKPPPKGAPSINYAHDGGG